MRTHREALVVQQQLGKAQEAPARESHYVQSLERGLSVITAFGPDTPELSLSDVARATGLTRAAVRRFLVIVYAVRVPTSRIMAVAINVGTRFPAYATSMGQVLLAGLDEAAFEAYLAAVDLVPFTDHTVTTRDDLRRRVGEVRSQGYALVGQELEFGLRSLAAPVRNRHGTVVAAVNLSSHVSRVDRERARDQLLPPLLRAVAEIEAVLSRA
jgi:IclR family transcriptional regulator, pca regulon regulatory protein